MKLLKTSVNLSENCVPLNSLKKKKKKTILQFRLLVFILHYHKLTDYNYGTEKFLSGRWGNV